MSMAVLFLSKQLQMWLQNFVAAIISHVWPMPCVSFFTKSTSLRICCCPIKNLYIQGDWSVNFAQPFLSQKVLLHYQIFWNNNFFNVPEQFQTLVWVFGICEIVMLTMKCYCYKAPPGLLSTTLAVDSGEKSQAEISTSQFHDIYHQIYLF